MNDVLDTLTVVRSESAALIRDEVRAFNQRTRLESAVRDAVLKCGATVDEASAASGLTPAEVQRVLADMPPLSDGDLAALVGLR